LIESLFTWVPVELKPMSVVSLLLLSFIAFLFSLNHKAIIKELNTHKNQSTKELKIIKTDHKCLRKDFEHTKSSLDSKIIEVMNNTQKEIRSLTKMINGLEVHTAEINASNKSISFSISEIKQDVRDLRKKK